MRVKSAFAGRSMSRSVIWPGAAIGVLAVFFAASSFKEDSDRNARAKRVNIIIRQIGHELLLQAGDSTSRILPVTEISEGTFVLKFENEFVFNHDSLMVLSQRLLSKTRFPQGYSVTVQECMNGSIIYGFEVNNTTPNILPCGGRTQTRGCYTIEFAFANFYEDARSAPGTLKTGATTNNLSLINAIAVGMLLLVTGSLLIWRFGKKPALSKNTPQNVIKESTAALPTLGKFLLNVKEQHLLWESEVINLTDKECKVLELLYKSFGELIPRETLMQEIWINEGVITGRSLDMFVSKLRKKLSRDPALKITNVHGRGYKLEISER